MRQWTFWEWVAYCCLLLGAMIMAADTGVRLAPDLAPYVPHFVHGAVWGFAPLAFVVLATSILLVREFVWHAPSNEGGGVRRSKIPKGLNWLSGYDAFQLATPGLLKEHQEARAAFEKLNQEMAVLAQGWSKAPVDQIAEFENKRDKLAPVLQTAQRKS
jgi:hypothetical protein